MLLKNSFTCVSFSSYLLFHLKSAFERDVQAGRKTEKWMEKKAHGTFHFHVLNAKDQGSCFCLLNVVKELDSRRSGEVQRDDEAERS